MGHWGVKSYENDDAHDALDAGFDRVHGEVYDALMDDDNPLTFEQVQKQLADARTLSSAIESVKEQAGDSETIENWDEVTKLALVGVVVRHAEMGVPIPSPWGRLAIEWLENEEIDWEEATKRRLRIQKELDLLRRAKADGDLANDSQ